MGSLNQSLNPYPLSVLGIPDSVLPESSVKTASPGFPLSVGELLEKNENVLQSSAHARGSNHGVFRSILSPATLPAPVPEGHLPQVLPPYLPVKISPTPSSYRLLGVALGLAGASAHPRAPQVPPLPLGLAGGAERPSMAPLLPFLRGPEMPRVRRKEGWGFCPT